MKRKNKLIYTLTMVFIIIVFLVIIFFGNKIEKIIYVDNLPKQPINHIRNIVKEEVPPEDEKKDDDGKKNNGGKKDNGNKESGNTTPEEVEPNTESPIKYTYNEDLTKGNYIYLVNQFPITDEVGKKLSGEYKTFDFKLEFQEAALGASFDITLEKMENSDLENSWIKAYLEKDGTALSQSIRDTGRVKTFNDYTPYSNKTNEVILYQGTVTASDISKGYRDFTLRMWISEDVQVVNEDYNEKTIIARVNVYAIGN